MDCPQKSGGCGAVAISGGLTVCVLVCTEQEIKINSY